MIPPLAPTFDAALRDVDAQGARFRIAAAHRLAEPSDGRSAEAVAALQTLISDPVGPVRQAALEAAGELGDEALLPSLLLAFDDADRGARQAAVLAAGRVDSDKSVRAIEALLEDARPEMRFSAVWTLTKTGRATPARITERLDDEDEEVRVIALECLSEIGGPGEADAIARHLDDGSPRVRFAAALALAALQDDRGAMELRGRLAVRDDAFDAAVALGDLRDDASRSALAAMAAKRLESPIRRAAAARALVRLGDGRGLPVLRKILRSWRIEARQYAVELVGELQLGELLPDVEQALRRSRPIEWPVYRTTLERLADRDPRARALLASIADPDQAP